MFDVAQPPGIRSSCQIGLPTVERVNDWSWEVSEAQAEWDLLQSRQLEKRLAPAEQVRMRAELANLMKKAEQGKIRFVSKLSRARSAQGHDADIVGRGQRVIELRPVGRSALRVPSYLIRLYYCEPKARPDQLLALHIASKPNNESGLDTQDAAITEAERRAALTLGQHPGHL